MMRLAMLVVALLLSIATVQAKELLRPALVQTIPLTGVEGRLDHLAIDLQGQRLFIAALVNNTVEVVNLQTGARVRTLTGFHEPQSVLFVPEYNALVVTNGADGTCQILDGSSFVVRQTAKLVEDADNLRYDARRKLLYVGYGDGGLAAIDPKEGKQLGAIKLAAHPEAFVIETAGPRIFINVPGVHQIVVADQNQQTVITTWPLQEAAANFPMALDEVHHRLFVGTRAPARLLVLDTDSGHTVASHESVGDPDEIFYDAKHQRIYVSGGEGFLQVFEQVTPDGYQSLIKLPTAAGARTALFVPELHQLFLAVPHRGHQQAEIRIYDMDSSGS